MTTPEDHATLAAPPYAKAVEERKLLSREPTLAMRRAADERQGTGHPHVDIWCAMWDAAALRGWRCMAASSDTADCDWPVCGCDPHAIRVVEALIESGWTASPVQPVQPAGVWEVLDEERRIIADKVREWAEQYAHATYGRSTFTRLAEWIEARSQGEASDAEAEASR